jgi:hypothetical protein
MQEAADFYTSIFVLWELLLLLKGLYHGWPSTACGMSGIALWLAVRHVHSIDF